MKKSYIQGDQVEISRAVTRERLARSGLADLKLDSSDPDLKLFREVLQSPHYKKGAKLAGVTRQSIKKLIGD